jgi:hypothetical protein
MRHFKTLVLCSLVAGLGAPLLASDATVDAKKNDSNILADMGQDAQAKSNHTDDCTPIAIACDDVLTGSTVGADNVFGNAAGDAVFVFTLAGETDVTLSLCNSDFDTLIRVLDGDPCTTTPAELAYNDDFCGLQSELTVFLTAGTYYTLVEGYSSSEGNYELAMTCAGAVDPCDTWTEMDVTLPYHGLGDNTGAQDIYGSVAGDVGYKFTIGVDSYVELATCFDGTLIDTDSHWFMDGGPCDGTYLGYNDGESACGWATHVIFDCDNPLPAGTYVVLITGYSNYEGAFELDLTASECLPVDANEMPVAFDLQQNHPNPFNPTTTIDFSMNETGVASLKVYDLSGREVATLVDGMTETGNHSVVFDAADLSSGVYFYTLTTAGMSQTQKMVLVK